VKYLLLITREPDAWAKLTDDEMNVVFGEFMQYTSALRDAKEYVDGAPLQDVSTATTVRIAHGERLVSDGPYAETHEVLGGYFVVDVPTLARAVEIAAGMPSTKRALGSVEIRPFVEVSA
jgi:hypothetical protein